MLNFYLGNIADSNHVIVVIIFLLIKLIMGIYAYTDSRKRNMQSIMWLLLVLVCPNCNQELNKICPSCKKIVKDSWNVCPYCTEILKNNIEDK